MKTLFSVYLVVLASVFGLAGCGGGSGSGSGGDGGGSNPPVLRSLIYELPVGQGDATYIVTPSGWDVLIDGGVGDDILEQLPKVMGSGDRRINQLILTHPDEDHLHGLLEVLKHYEVDEIWETGVISLSPEYPIWHKLIKDRGITLRKVHAGESSVHGDVRFDVIGPVKSMDGVLMLDPNNSSIVIKLGYGNFNALFLGDALVEEQSSIIDQIGAQDFLKIPHHGAKNAAYEPMWQQAKPEVAVLPVSDLSQYVGLPSSEVVGFMQRYAKKTYRTNLNGIITVKTDGVGMEVSGER